MIERLRDLWDEYAFESLIGLCIIVIVILSLFRIGKKGTWSKTYTYIMNQPKKPGRAPPRDSKGEIECRRVLEKIFNRPFDKSRPDFLNNPVTGGNFNLELDCFCPELRLACEYSGQQHYKFVPYFHKNKEAFLNQKYRDQLKKEWCTKNGINLIEVPYTVKIPDIEKYIVDGLRYLGYKI